MKPKIAVVGSHLLDGVDSRLIALAQEIGVAIAKENCILLSGGGDGLVRYAEVAAFEHGGEVLIISPASNLVEHVEKYQLPTDYCSIILFTGFGYKGRNVILARSCDAMIVIRGGIGTLNEITIAFDEAKPIGILQNTGGVANQIESLLKGMDLLVGNRILFGHNPSKILRNILQFCKIRNE